MLHAIHLIWLEPLQVIDEFWRACASLLHRLWSLDYIHCYSVKDTIDGQVDLNWIELFGRSHGVDYSSYDGYASHGGGCICRRFIVIFCLSTFDSFWWFCDFDETWYFYWFLDFPLELGGSDGTFCYWPRFYELFEDSVLLLRWDDEVRIIVPMRRIIFMMRRIIFRRWSYLSLFWVLVISIWDGSIDGSWLFGWDFVWFFRWKLVFRWISIGCFTFIFFPLSQLRQRVSYDWIPYTGCVSWWVALGRKFTWIFSNYFSSEGAVFRHRRSFIV